MNGENRQSLEVNHSTSKLHFGNFVKFSEVRISKLPKTDRHETAIWEGAKRLKLESAKEKQRIVEQPVNILYMNMV